ncbi:MAG: type II toxin-antitoxin system VapC family toxin [Candidatus Micrarchaeales archaeon]
MACLDTSVIIAFLRGDKDVIDAVNSYEKNEGLSTTSVSEYELLRHASKLGTEKVFHIFNDISVYFFDRVAARKAAEIYRALQTKGKIINENDILIAAISVVNNEVLITRDRKFEYIEGINLKIL